MLHNILGGKLPRIHTGNELLDMLLNFLLDNAASK